jgi:nucleoside-diphosphate-sugar epimerase
MGERLFCFGLGYTAQVFAAGRRVAGWRVAGTTRAGGKRATLGAAGVDTHVFDRDHPLCDAKAALAGTTHLLISIPPEDAGELVLAAHADDIAALARREGKLAWIGYLSSTAVYGDWGGAWVDETSPLKGDSPRARRRIVAERAWLEFGERQGLAVHVFRLSGIYGKGRSAIDDVRAGVARRIRKPGHAFSRIHVHDIARVLEASIARPRASAIYNVADDEPAPSADVVAHAFALLGVPPPPEVPFSEASLSPMGKAFYADNRRIRNDLIKRELGVELAYPNYRVGLSSLI